MIIKYIEMFNNLYNQSNLSSQFHLPVTNQTINQTINQTHFNSCPTARANVSNQFNVPMVNQVTNQFNSRPSARANISMTNQCPSTRANISMTNHCSSARTNIRMTNRRRSNSNLSNSCSRISSNRCYHNSEIEIDSDTEFEQKNEMTNFRNDSNDSDDDQMHSDDERNNLLNNFPIVSHQTVVNTGRCSTLHGFRVNKLVSNSDCDAANHDPDLINAWGIAIIDCTLWVCDNGTGSLSNYNLLGNKLSRSVIVLDERNEKASPTGIIENRTGRFLITKNGITRPSLFLIVTENGTINGYNPQLDVDNTILILNRRVLGSIYTGLTIAHHFLYVANFMTGKIDVFDHNFNEVIGFPFIDHHLCDPLPVDFVPFNIVNIDNLLYVLYARQTPPFSEHEELNVGNGFISIFRTNGMFVRRFVSGNFLNYPWGLVKAPAEFGFPPGTLLVANHGDGFINAYDTNGVHIQRLRYAACGNLIKLPGLRGLAVNFGTGIMYWTSGTTRSLLVDNDHTARTVFYEPNQINFTRSMNQCEGLVGTIQRHC